MTGEKTRTKNKTNFLIVREQSISFNSSLFEKNKTITTKWYSQLNKIVFQVTFEFSIKEIEQKNWRPLCKQASRKPTEGQFKSFFKVFVSRKLNGVWQSEMRGREILAHKTRKPRAPTLKRNFAAFLSCLLTFFFEMAKYLNVITIQSSFIN